ncbi:hypothetical protein [Chryseobacterium sp. 5_R23647]|uniref:hypothetical protein n=2 Tax=Chryseobacterium TaxID=59732 RepID=UPI000F50A931|nr:hypothetical protein [Chryseobacterium sp. 5_R23647]
MIFKIYMFISIISFSFLFSQTHPNANDTLECNGRLDDSIMSRLEYAYSNKYEKEDKSNIIKPKINLGWCGTEIGQQARNLACTNAKLIEKKYPFILDEIKKITKDYPGYSDLNIFWINKKRKDNDDLNFKFNEAEETKIQQWKSEKNHSYFSVVIISNEIDDHNEYIQLEITFPKELIIKCYELSYNNIWSFKPI